MADNKPWCQNCHSSWYKQWKTSAIGSHNLFWIKTYKLVFLWKIVVDTYHEWENIFQLWEISDQRCQRVHHKCALHTQNIIPYNESMTNFFRNIKSYDIPHDEQDEKKSIREGMLVFVVQFLWEVIGSNFSTSESTMTPKLLQSKSTQHRIFLDISWCVVIG